MNRAGAMPRLLGGGRWRALAAVAVLHVLQAAAAAAAAFAMRDVFAALHAGATPGDAALAVLAGSGLAIAALRVLARLAGEVAAQAYVLEIRLALFDRAARMAAHDVAQRRAGYMALRFVGDLAALRNWPAIGLPRLIAAGVVLPVTLVVLTHLHPPFLGAVAPVLAVGALVLLAGGLRLPGLHRRLRARRAAIAADMTERMPLAPDLSALGRRGREAGRIASRTRGMIRAALARLRLSEALRALPEALAGLAAVLLIRAGLATGAAPATVAGGLAALAIALAPLRELATVWNHLAAYRTARLKCAAALSRPARATAGSGRSLPRGPLALRLEQVCAGPVAGLTARIPAGARVRLSGPNGCGKSLLMRLLAGRDVTTAGRILLAGRPIGDLSQGALRRQVALVSDDPPILRGSLRRALSLGIDPRPDDATLSETAGRFGLGQLLAARGGLGGQVAEGGRDLSDGQRLLVAVTRAALGAPGLVLLDATPEALDGDARQAVSSWLTGLDATIIATDPGHGWPLDYAQELRLSTAPAD